MKTIHAIKTLRHYKSAGPDHEADTTVALCQCNGFEVTIAGNKVKEAKRHLDFHLSKHGVEGVDS